MGVPFFVHVDTDTTHRQVQSMVWDRVKFTAWPAQFYKEKQHAILTSRGDVFVPAPFIAWVLSNRTADRRFSIATLRNVLGLIASYSCVRLPEVYPFESAHSPTTFTEGERVEVFWVNDNCCFGGKVERCVYDDVSGMLIKVTVRYVFLYVFVCLCVCVCVCVCDRERNVYRTTVCVCACDRERG